MTIAIVAYRPDWVDAFRALAARLREVAPPGTRLHHIGSTAVPGLAAKDIIDMQLSVANLTDVDASAMDAIGFVEKHGLADHAPACIDLPARELAKRFFNGSGWGSGRAANLHVREFGRFNQRYPLLCRDYLRAHPGAAAAYAIIKSRLAVRFPDDVEAYYAIKDPVFDLIMTGAEDWAARSGWRQPTAD